MVGTELTSRQVMRALAVARGAALARVGIGLGLVFGTRRVLRAVLNGEEPSSEFVLFARTVGIRDTLFGLGCLSSSLDPTRTAETRRWVQVWLANELADVIAAVSAFRQLGTAGASTSAAAPLPLVAIDLWTLRHLERIVRDGPARSTS